MVVSLEDLLRERDEAIDSLRPAHLLRDLGNGHYGFASKLAEIDVKAVDRRKMAVPCTITTQDEDRSNDVIITAGIDLAHHKSNPVVMYSHGFGGLALPIGKAESPEGVYSVQRGKGLVRSTTYFSQSLLEAEQIFQLVEEGILRGVSVGLTVKKAEYRKDHPDDYKGWPGLLISQSEMFEYSHTPLPQNRAALADRVGKGVLAGKPIAATLLKSFAPYMPEPKQTVVGGFDNTPREKSMPAVIDPPTTPPVVQSIIPADVEKMIAEALAKAAAAPSPPSIPPAPEPGAVIEPLITDDAKDWPTGATTLRDCHDRLMEIGEHIDGYFKRQDSSVVKEYLSGLAGTIEECTLRCSELFKGAYPDLEPFDVDLGAADGQSLILPAMQRLRLSAEAIKKARRESLAKERLPGHVRGTLEKARACLTELAALTGPIAASQKTAAELLARAVAGLASELGTDDSEVIQALKTENAFLKEGLAKAEANHERLKREFNKALRGR